MVMIALRQGIDRLSLVLATIISLAVPIVCLAVPSSAEDWNAIEARARGQTVYFNAWGGSAAINDYIGWVRETVSERYGVTLVHVKVDDIATVVTRLLAEKTAGGAGTVDLMWVNGENFAALKREGLLGAPFAEALPNFSLVDVEKKPTTLVDFTVPTEGLEAPWGMAQLVFMADATRVPLPPRSLDELAAWADGHPGRFTYPQPPDFLGTTFLKQALIALAPDPEVLSHPVDGDAFDDATAPLWAFLDRLHPSLWRSGKSFPANGPNLLRLLGDGEIDIAFTFNPNEASTAIIRGELPDTVDSFVLEGGTIGNTHFVAIPFNAQAREGAMVVANFLLSPEAQAKKEDPAVWGDPTVLALDRLSPEDRVRFGTIPLGPATLSSQELGPVLPEPHPSWTDAVEAAWKRRYAG